MSVQSTQFTDLSVGATFVVSLRDEVNGGYQKHLGGTILCQ
ncbi:hypothetical protein ACT7CZ_28370 [Bacillus cereus]